MSLPTGMTAGYRYDADGRRVESLLDGQVTRYLWDEASIYGDVILETGGDGDILASYVLGGMNILSQTREGDTSYFSQDALGSTRALTDASGNLTDAYSYNAFGELFTQTGDTTNHYLFTGQQYDTATGLYSMRARYYDPSVGRFLTRDMAAIMFDNPVELNRYVYVANNPVNLVDPTGNTAFGSSIGGYQPSQQNRWALALTGQTVALLLAAPLIGFIAYLLQAALPDYAPYYPEIEVLPRPPGEQGTPGGDQDPGGGHDRLNEILKWIKRLWWLLPIPWLLPGSDPLPQPDPDRDDKDKHIFYYNNAASYPAPGRRTQTIINALNRITSIPGVLGHISFLRSADTRHQQIRQGWTENILMGRKFEAERIIFFASRGALVRVNSTAAHFDIMVQTFGTIQYVEVKWSRNAMPYATQRDIINSARTHPTGTYLAESNNQITPSVAAYLNKNGGRLLPFPYP